MIRTLLTTTALAALLATGAVAQQSSTDLLSQGYDIIDTDGLASRLMGMPIYSSATDDAEQIGEINDLVINESGDVAAVLVGVGGFLGVGEKNVAVDYGQLQWTTAADNTERLVLETTKEALNNAPGVEFEDDSPEQTAVAPAAPNAMGTAAPADQAAAPVDPNAATGTEQTDTAAAPVDPNATTQQTDTAAAPLPADGMAEDTTETGSIGTQPGMAGDMPAFDRSGLTELDEMTLTAEELIGTNVYGPNDEHIGTIGDFAFAEDGQSIDAVIVDVGGFLGIGAKEVAIGFEDLNFATDEGNNRYLLIDATKEQLEAQAAFDRNTYKNDRDNQRLLVQTS